MGTETDLTNEGTHQKGSKQKRVSRSTKSTLPQEEHCKNKFASRSPKSTSPTRAPTKREANKNVSQGQRNRLYHKKSTEKNKFASRSPKSTSPTRAPIKREANKTCLKVNEIDFTTRRALQKINLPQGHRNRPHQR